jgi:hypothetical protein
MEREEIIYSIKIDLEGSNAALKQYADTLTSVAKSQGEMNVMTKEQLELMDREEKAKKKTKEAIEAEAGSIAALREQNKKLTAERNATSLATEEGRKRVAEINEELNKNNAVIKDNVDAYTKQKIGIGDYSGALDKLIPGLGATTNGLKGVGKEMWALVANPVGATIAAIALAFGALIKYFKGSEEGQNRLNQIMAIGSALMEKVWDIVEGLGEALYNAATNPKKAFMDLVEFIKTNLINRFTALGVIIEGIADLDFKKVANGVLQLGTGVEDVIGKTQALAREVTATFNEAITQGNRLAALQAKIDQDDRKAVVERAKVALEVAKLREKAVTQEGEEKRKTIDQAIALEQKLSDAEVARAKTKLQQAQLELQTEGDTKEAKMKVAEAEAAVISAEAQRFEATLRFQKELERLRDEELKKRQEAAKADEAFWKEADDRAWQATQDSLERDKIARTKRLKDEEEAAKKKKLIDQTVTDQVNRNLGLVFLNQQINYKAGFELFKKGALAQLLADTNKAAVGAMSSASSIPLIGWLLGPLAYAMTYAKGIASYLLVSGMNVGFAKGGRTVSGTRIQGHHGIPIHRDNGDDLLATVKTGEVILNAEQQRRLGGAKTFKRIGVPGFAVGGVTGLGAAAGFETRSAEANFQQGRILTKLDQLIERPPQSIMVLQDFEAKQLEKDLTEQRARVV